jgi:uncharacterized protein involved in exopolysaccharide biosynthesis
VYLSHARLQLETTSTQRQTDEARDSSHLLNAAQTLTSGAVLDDLMQRLSRSNTDPSDTITSVDVLRNMLSAVPIDGTNVIELHAQGSNRQLLPRILSAWIEAYRQTYRSAFDQSSKVALDETRSMVQQLRQNLLDKRRDMEGFRKKYDIVSLEREENQAMAQLKGLNTALNDARAKEVNAQARLNATRDNIAAGKTVDRPRDQTIVASLEKRAQEMREKMRDFEHDYTAKYLEIDPKYRALRVKPDTARAADRNRAQCELATGTAWWRGGTGERQGNGAAFAAAARGPQTGSAGFHDALRRAYGARQPSCAEWRIHTIR